MSVSSNRPIILRIRLWVGVLIAGLVISGITAFPIATEFQYLLDPILELEPTNNPQEGWLNYVSYGIKDTYAAYPFIAYGTDWLAFAHLVIAMVFIGLWRDPVRNQWLVTFGFMACAAIVPLALIAGEVRGIPWWWRLGDIAFGLVACGPLLVIRHHIRQLEARQTPNALMTRNPSRP